MNGPHDLGGAHGFGPVAPEPNEPVFHAEWERRVFALSLAMGATGVWNIDMSRHARERIPPADYLASSYYEIWLKGMERLLVEQGLATGGDLEAGAQRSPGDRAAAQADRGQGPGARSPRAAPTERPSAAPALFDIGDRVRARVDEPARPHAPAALRARPRRNDRRHPRRPRLSRIRARPGAAKTRTGSIRSRSTREEIWGPEARAGDEIFLDLWEPYLERA